MALPLLPTEFDIEPIRVIISESVSGESLSREACQAYWQVAGYGIHVVRPEGGLRQELMQAATVAPDHDEAIRQARLLVEEYERTDGDEIKLPKIPDALWQYIIDKLVEALSKKLFPTG